MLNQTIATPPVPKGGVAPHSLGWLTIAGPPPIPGFWLPRSGKVIPPVPLPDAVAILVRSKAWLVGQVVVFTERGNIDYDQVRLIARQGSGSKFQMFGGGSPVAGDVAVYDANGNVIDGGGVALLVPQYVEKTSTYGMSATDGTVNCTSGTFTVTLPSASGLQGRIRNVKNSGSGSITVATSGGQTIDGQATMIINSGSNLQVQSTGSNWIIL